MYKVQLSIIFLIASILVSCDPVDPVDDQDPKNLTVELSYSETEPGMVLITANALHAVNYVFYLGSQTDPIDENSSGSFEYLFTDSGIYQIEIRAYGLSGRFIKENREIQIDLGIEVSVEEGYFSPETYDGYNLVWNDEFDGPGLNENFWRFELGNGCPNCGWGNNELQYYRRENASVEGGVLKIEAREEKYSGSNYTSARIISQNLKSFKYGRVDVRALLPKGQGIWPAIWMLGNNINSVGWPACGEIDIMEMVGGSGKENTSHGTLHYEIDGEHVYHGGSKTLSSGTLNDEYHVFSIVWDKDRIKWYLNNAEYYSADISSDDLSEFHQEFFFILNVAVGGNWPGSPDQTTVFPQKMNVDYIRVFQK